MTTNVKFAKVRPDAIIPSKRPEDAGFDLYANFVEDYIEIQPHETKLIPTGIASACSQEYALVLFERGSTGSKGMARRAGIVDSSFRGEIFVGITNTTDTFLYISKLSNEELIRAVHPEGVHLYQYDERGVQINHYDMSNEQILAGWTVYPYSKAIAQALVLPVPEVEIEEISYEELQAIPSERGLGKLGSSNK